MDTSLKNGSNTAVIWDIDGTLVDSEPNHHRALAAVCNVYDVCIDDFDDNYFVGLHMQEVWRILQPRFPITTDFDIWHRAINIEYARNVTDVAVRPHAAEAIASLWKHGIRQAAVSNSARAIVEANLRIIDGAERFEFALSIDDVLCGKPDPQPYFQACAQLRLSPVQVLVVEDSPSGLRAANAAGAWCLAYRTAEFPALMAPRSGQVIDNLIEVVSITLARSRVKA